MRTLLRKKFVLAVFCLLVLPATASADAVVTGPCGSSTLAGQMIFGPCALPGGGVRYMARKQLSRQTVF